jgi:hypothetical protein
MKSLRLNQKKVLALVAALILVIAIGSFLVYRHVKPNGNGCGVDAVSANIKSTKDFDTPCEIIITINNTNGISADDVRRIVQPIKGTVEDNDLSESGIYFINVPAGTEEKSIQYLNSQPFIGSATRNHCCEVAN